jgi:MoaA/NifB/PqqE/SkfB family radical SAM enzyme
MLSRGGIWHLFCERYVVSTPSSWSGDSREIEYWEESSVAGFEKRRREAVLLEARLKRPSITKRIDNITEIREEYLSEAPPCPRSVKIELTAMCNFSCQFCARSKRLREVGKIDRGFYERILVDLLRAPVPCWALFTEGHVTWDGRLSECCFDHDGRFDMGDLKRTAFMDAWHSPDFRRLRAAHLREEVAGTVCEQCVSYEAEGGPVGEPIRADASHDD